MPSTITAYKTFAADTKARASEVNTNFSNYRGISLPIEESTVSASHLVHGLGTSEHRWGSSYVKDLSFGDTGGTWLISPSTINGGDLDIKFQGVSAVTISPGGTMRGARIVNALVFVDPLTATVAVAEGGPDTAGGINISEFNISLTSQGKPIEIGFSFRWNGNTIGSGGSVDTNLTFNTTAGYTLYWTLDTTTGEVIHGTDIDKRDPGHMNAGGFLGLYEGLTAGGHTLFLMLRRGNAGRLTFNNLKSFAREFN